MENGVLLITECYSHVGLGNEDRQIPMFSKWSPDGSLIFFDKGPAIHSIDAGGSRPAQRIVGASREIVTDGRSWGYVGARPNFDISPDGSKLVYSTCRYRTPADDLEDSQSADVADIPTRWPPRNDGHLPREVADEIRSYDFEIALSNIDGAEQKRLTTDGGNYPVWSPDGTQIAFSGSDGLYTMAEDGSDVQLVHGKYAQFTAWSPDGRLIAFVGFDNRRRFIYTVSIDGSSATRVSETLGPPAWSPDGRRLALVAPYGDGASLYTFAPDGSDPIKVIGIIDDMPAQIFLRFGHSRLGVRFSVRSVSWSPDGTEILVGPYLVNLESPETLSLLELEGLELLAGPRSRSWDLYQVLTAWSPDGSAIAVRVEGRNPYTIDRDDAEFSVLPAASGGGVETRIAACSEGHLVGDPDKNPGLVQDCETLMHARDTLAGEGKVDWNKHTSIRLWQGVGVGGSPSRVTHVNLYDAGLTGSIPAELGNLVSLEELSLPGNKLTGSIPPELGKLVNLRRLTLTTNKLTGSIPARLGNLWNLKTLSLWNNSLTGSIPPELGKLVSLEELYLGENKLTGSIPPELGSRRNLRTLNLGSNELTGSIPPELGSLPNLRTLNLGSNELTGSIPAELGKLVSLEELYLGENKLTGSIPAELGRLVSLEELYLGENKLTGSIPPELGSLPNLRTLNLGSNELTGSIPAELGSLPNLRTLRLGDNELTGSIPPELGNLVNLKRLTLVGNELTGGIPAELGKLGSLRNLEVSDNELRGCIQLAYGTEVCADQ